MEKWIMNKDEIEMKTEMKVKSNKVGFKVDLK